MRFYILTGFPKIFNGFLDDGIMRIARSKGKVDVNIVNLRDFTTDKHRKIDDRPYGGGPGMILKVEPIVKAFEYVKEKEKIEVKAILFTPTGAMFTQEEAFRLVKEEVIVFICGHYEGIDERVKLILKPYELSVGRFILSGGEVASMVVMDAVTRLIPGVVGNPASVVNESFTNLEKDYVQYTRPRNFRGLKVPDVLISGNHKEIEKWRLENT